MKKFGRTLFALVLLTTLTNCEEIDDCQESDKIMINHKGKIIEVSINAWVAHEAHGDTFIECVPKK